MVHGDDDGLRLPPKIASAHVVLLPIIHKEESRAEVLSFCHKLAQGLNAMRYREGPLIAIVDERDVRGGEKTWSWIKKGIPIRIEIGPRDMEGDRFPIYRRDLPHREAKVFSRAEILSHIHEELDGIQANLFQQAVAFREAHIKKFLNMLMKKRQTSTTTT